MSTPKFYFRAAELRGYSKEQAKALLDQIREEGVDEGSDKDLDVYDRALLRLSFGSAPSQRWRREALEYLHERGVQNVTNELRDAIAFVLGMSRGKGQSSANPSPPPQSERA